MANWQKKILSSFLVLMIFGCVNDKNSYENTAMITIRLSVQTDKDEIFQIYYLDDQSVDHYSIKKRLIAKLQGNERNQNIVFQLPIDKPLKKFRIDLGESNNQSCLEIDKMEMSLGKAKVHIDPKAYHRYFNSNIYVEQKNSIFCRRTINGKYDPFIESSALLIKKLELELR